MNTLPLDRLSRRETLALLSLLGLASCDSGALRIGPGDTDLMLRALIEAPAHGFAAGRFPIAGLEEELAAGDRNTQRAAYRRLQDLVLDYARAQHGRDVSPRQINIKWGMRPAAYDAEAAFAEARQRNKVGQWLVSLPPPDPRYEALRTGFLHYVGIANAGGWPTIEEGPPFALGQSDARVAAVRARLAVEDEALREAQPETPFDQALQAGLARFQARHGLIANGVVDEDTLDALNVPAAVRVAQLRANLQRWRWTPRAMAPTRVEVNSGASVVHAFSDGQPALSMLAAVGKPGDETPILASHIHTIVFNPTWNVPDSIASEELWPRERRDPGYLARNNFTIENGEGGSRIVQQPGADNALGRVKFLFDNRYGVYLHDTPARSAFTREQRAVSHGCVRLERALDLANHLLAREPGWSPTRVSEALASFETVEVKLPEPVPVYINYWTAFVEPGGVAFRQDVYDWDQTVLAATNTSRGREQG